MTKLVGKGFDGASNMSGCVSGVSTRLKQLYPSAKYFTHCRNHALNLAIVASCKQCPDIRSFMDTFKQLTLFFGYSAKRKHILQKHLKDTEVQKNLLADSIEDEDLLVPDRNYRGLPTLSDTRWLTRVDSIACLLKHFKGICEAVEEIRASSTGQSSSDADSYLNRLMKFEFLASAAISRHILAYTRPLTVALQGKKCDLLKAHAMAQRLVKALEAERKEEKFRTLWQEIKDVAGTLNLEPVKKRTTSVQRHRVNPPVNDVEAHYRVSYFYYFLDHTISHLKTRFPAELEGALLGTYLLPSKIKFLTNETVTKIKSEFKDILPYATEFEVEVNTWKIYMTELNYTPSNDKSDLLDGSCIARRSCEFYPNINAILSLLLVLPVGSCSCERSFSALRRLKTWCRTTMTDARLDSLAVGSINCGRTPTPEQVLRVWDRSGHRRIATALQLIQQ
ncbi:hypothetical protein SPONL_1737 [uncultured Candidatus Thioglobus sp.]|nr:hypothetical protein SPONL_1737 [uncultured Candidatus Thioglobus sp.]